MGDINYDAKVGEVDWKACGECRFHNGKTCIKHVDLGDLVEDCDDLYCPLFKAGEWYSDEEILEKARLKGIIFDVPGQKILFGVKDLTKEKYIAQVREEGEE